MDKRGEEWLHSVAMGAPDMTSHNHTDLSSEPDASHEPSSENARQ
jgi:hypothetical protein